MLWKVARIAIAVESLSLSTLAIGIRIPATPRQLFNRFHIFQRKRSVFTMGNSQSQPNGDNVDTAAAATAAVYGSGSEIESVDDNNSAASVAESDDSNKEEEPDYTKLDIVSTFDSDM
eukprot:scaffold28902_cov80-Skeletonema_dohrnii-CCMP3373.AAC.2